MSVFIGEKNKRVELAERKDAINPNLFTGSKDFTGNWLSVDLVKQKDKYLDFTAVYVDWAWNGISQYIDVKAGETFTASAYVKAKAGSSLDLYTCLTADNEDGHTKTETNPDNQTITAMGDWQRVSITFTVTIDGTIRPRVESGDSNVPFWIAGMKLEKGPVATDWCPALEDYAWESDITSLQNTANNIDGTDNIASAVDVNTLVGEAGKVHVYRCTNGGNTNTPSWISYKDGYLIVLNWDGNAKTQLWFPVSVGNSAQFGIRYWEGSNASSWNHMSTTDYVDSDITNLQNTIQANKTDVTNLQSMITGLSTKVDSITTKLSDGTLVQVAHFEASDEQKAVDWSKDDGKGGLPKFSMIDY